MKQSRKPKPLDCFTLFAMAQTDENFSQNSTFSACNFITNLSKKNLIFAAQIP